jgi:hypothetical protein
MVQFWHFNNESAPLLGPNFPPGQALHSDAFEMSFQSPTSQSLHTPPLLEYVPGIHDLQIFGSIAVKYSPS